MRLGDVSLNGRIWPLEGAIANMAHVAVKGMHLTGLNNGEKQGGCDEVTLLVYI